MFEEGQDSSTKTKSRQEPILKPPVDRTRRGEPVDSVRSVPIKQHESLTLWTPCLFCGNYKFVLF